MTPILAIALFCEDIREERNGQDTLVGVMPDNINLPELPAAIPKFGVYVRVSFGTEEDIGAIGVRVRLPDGHVVPSEISKNLVDQSRAAAIARGNTLVGLISKVMINPLPITRKGKIEVFARIRDEEFVCGAISVHNDPDDTPVRPNEVRGELKIKL